MKLAIVATALALYCLFSVTVQAASGVCNRTAPLDQTTDGEPWSQGSFSTRQGDIPFWVLAAANPLGADYIDRNGHSITDLCIVYRIDNLSEKRTIRGLSWPELSIPYLGYDIAPGASSEEWPRFARGVLKKPGWYETKLKMVGGPETTVRTLFPQEVTPRRFAPAPLSTLFTPDALSEIGRAGVRLAYIDKFEIPPDGTLPTIGGRFAAAENVWLEVTSSVATHEDGIRLDYEVNASEGANLSVPLLAAFAELSPRPTISDTVELAKSLDKFREVPFNNLEFSLISSQNDTDLGGFGVYVVEQPITVQTSDGEACIMQLVYSFVPISVPYTKCNLSDEIIQEIAR